MSAYVKQIGSKKVAIGISKYPNRKNLVLYIQEGSCLTKVATFSSNKLAFKFMDTFADFIGAQRFYWLKEMGE